MSDKLNKDFEELIRNKLENYPTPVDSSIWDAIESSLIKRKRINYIRVVAGVAAAAVVFLVLAINLFKPENNSQDQIIGQVDQNVQTDDTAKLKQQPANSLQQTAVNQSAEQTQGTNQTHDANKDADKQDDTRNEQIQQNQTASKRIADYNTDASTVKESATKVQTAMITPDLVTDNPPVGSYSRISTVTPSSINSLIVQDSKITLPGQLSVSGIPAATKAVTGKQVAKPNINNNLGTNKSWVLSANLGTGNYHNTGSDNANIYTTQPLLTLDNSGGYVKNQYRNAVMIPDNAKIQYGMSMSAKLSVRKNITSKWAVETGINYTYLPTKYNWNQNSASQQLHYLGIPLNAVYYVASKPNWNVYVSAGGMVEKGVYAAIKRNDGINSKVKFSGLQYSVNGALGVTYKLYRNIGLFFEPQFGYYFNNNQPESIRTAWPVSINLGAGFRFNL